MLFANQCEIYKNVSQSANKLNGKSKLGRVWEDANKLDSCLWQDP